MSKISSNKVKINSINFYLLVSILFHVSIFIFTGIKKDTSLGDKVIPIEILDIRTMAGKGEYFEKYQPKDAKNVREEVNNADEIKKDLKEKVSKEDKGLNINKVSKIIQERENITSPSNSIEKLARGSQGKLESNELEKGSLQGKGIEKITCLSCIKPRYPKIAIKRGYEGSIKIKILISKNGEVIDYKIVKSSGFKILDQSGIEAAQKSTFYPIKKESTLNIEYNMKLNR